ncbi:hypothetical protein TVAG_125040 [Trichomonas vaginalis G3]|uniref:Mediator of RNA polymerase II transcription subunit 23 n=1 Tax=Trichomonas vaginalis (strain ATCC PRA-98 / G3) TaxID=412133 RepID=A2EIL0_TRIV3|nr:hypothetical protein TVAGG3_0199630 [Trichomonas vaginalis G3]EAY07531.1 hypothetical protein TVAG_125040 [Trichomonas vaginalis G3]KAI5550515.1 hypothetical protein TVAGG3_0199630 [Trichomonas vaginalis G3]|eukprot:XP_001319754.1 hypothetical protein [Trichomonas vaginalis G3]
MNPNYVTEFARKPYLQPDPGNNQPFTPPYSYGDNTNSILCNDPYQNVPLLNDLDQKFQNLERNTPQMIRLQDQRLDPGPQRYVHDGSVPLWMEMLADTKIHPYSLCPFPKLEEKDLTYVLENIFDQNVSPDRAAWALHYIIKKIGTKIDLTKMLLEFEKVDEHYFAKVCFYCYQDNLLDHLEFLQGAISKLQPESLKIFKNEILRTHVLTVAAFTSSIDYLSIMDEQLLLQQTHLIQLSLFYHLGQNFTPKLNFPFGPKIDDLMMRNDLLKKRARSVYQIVTPRLLSLATQLSNIIVASYPYYDEAKTSLAIESAAIYASDEACSQVAIKLFEILFWFEGENAELSSIIVWTLTKIQVKEFDLPSLVDFYYEHVDQISKLRHLFAELQAFGLVSYTSFVSYIIQAGYILTRPQATSVIISSVPFYVRSPRAMKLFESCMLKLGITGYDQIVREITVKPLELTILANMDKVKQLPYPVIYSIVSYAINETKHVSEIIDVISQLNLDTLFPLLFDKITDSKDLKFSINTHIMPRVQNSLPFLVSHGQFSKFIDLITQNSSDPVMMDIILFIYEHYKDIPRRPELNEISKTAKGVSIDSTKIRELFRRFSYLCSLHIFDAFHNVETTHDFELIFRTFLSQLLHFHSLKSSTMIKFFLEFAQSGCVTLPPNFFIKHLLAVLLTFPEEDFDDRLNLLLQDFFTFIFEKGLFQPANFLAESKKRRGSANSSPFGKIANIFLTICKARLDLFTPLNCFSSNSIKGYQGEPMLTELVDVLKNAPLPQLTDDVLKSFDNMTLAGTYFALLPEEARDPNFEKAFEFFKQNANDSNCRLLAYWLKYHLYFSGPPSQGLPQPITPDKQATTKFASTVALAFYNLFMSLSPENEADMKRRDVFLNAWSLICEKDFSRYKTPIFANAALQQATNAIKASNLTYTPFLVDYLHPALICGVSSNQNEILVDTLLAAPVPQDQQGPFFYTAASVFVSYIYRQTFPIQTRIENTACRLLEWIYSVSEQRSRGFDFLLDSLNFITCFTSNLTQINQTSYHFKLREIYIKLPEQVRSIIILNIPPQAFEPDKEPLFFNVTAPEPVNLQPPQMQMPQMSMPQPMPMQPPPQQQMPMQQQQQQQMQQPINLPMDYEMMNSTFGDIDDFNFDI